MKFCEVCHAMTIKKRYLYDPNQWSGRGKYMRICKGCMKFWKNRPIQSIKTIESEEAMILNELEGNDAVQGP